MKIWDLPARGEVMSGRDLGIGVTVARLTLDQLV
jgi:hypothetical protein